MHAFQKKKKKKYLDVDYHNFEASKSVASSSLRSVDMDLKRACFQLQFWSRM